MGGSFFSASCGGRFNFSPVLTQIQLLLAGCAPKAFSKLSYPVPAIQHPLHPVIRFALRTEHGEVSVGHDPYAFPFLLTEFDLYLMGEGRHYDTYEKLGRAHENGRRCDGRALCGVGSQRAPSQRGRRFQSLGRSGPPYACARLFWNLGIVHPDFGEGAIYKFEIIGPHGAVVSAESGPVRFPR